MLDMKVTPWHGDSPQSKKTAAKRLPEGILLITPESLKLGSFGMPDGYGRRSSR